MFESWLEQEKAVIKSRFRNVHILCVFIAVLMLPHVLLSLIMLLDGGGVGSLCVLIFSIFVMIFILFMGNYKKRFIKPLLASIQQELPNENDRQKFAQQMQEHAVCISYQPLPQTKFCDVMVAKDYCYMRQPRKSRIIQNSQLQRIDLTYENYYIGNRGHMRWCYALTLYTSDNENPVWKGYFMDKEDVSQAFIQFQAILPPGATVQDLVANPEKRQKKVWWKTLLEWVLYFIFLAAMIFLVKYLRS